jgi:hypothetical protein
VRSASEKRKHARFVAIALTPARPAASMGDIKGSLNPIKILLERSGGGNCEAISDRAGVSL